MSTKTNMHISEEAHRDEQQLYFKRNFWAHSLDGGFYMGGAAFIAADMVMPPIVKALGGQAWLVSLVSVLALVGLMLPSLFVAHLLERIAWKKPMLVITGVIQRMPFLLAGLCLIFFAESCPFLTLICVVAAPFLSGLACGLTYPAWLELVAKTIPGRHGASLFAVRLVLAGLVGLVAGPVIVGILAVFPGTTGYGFLHLVAFSFLMVSFVFFMRIKETRLPPHRHEREHSVIDSIREIPGILRGDPRFRVYLLALCFQYGTYVALPFMSIHALEKLRCPEEFLGYLVTASIFGKVFANSFCTWQGERLGPRRIMAAGLLLYTVSLVLSSFAGSFVFFLTAFFVLGLAQDSINVATGAFAISLPPRVRRIKYLSIINVSILPAILSAWGLGALLWMLSGDFRCVAATAVSLILLSLFFLSRMSSETGASASS